MCDSADIATTFLLPSSVCVCMYVSLLYMMSLKSSLTYFCNFCTIIIIILSCVVFHNHTAFKLQGSVRIAVYINIVIISHN